MRLFKVTVTVAGVVRWSDSAVPWHRLVIVMKELQRDYRTGKVTAELP
jgi:hypothetical protein